MKNYLSLLLLAGFLFAASPVFAAPPPPHFNGGIHAGRRMPPPPPRHMHNHMHGMVMYNSSPMYGGYYGNSICGNCYCPSYGICRPFRHPGPQYSTGFYISF